MTQVQTDAGPITVLSEKERDQLRRALDGAKYKMRSYQQRYLGDDSRFRLAMWCRQTGKSFTGALDDVITTEQTGYGTMQLSASADLTKELMLKTAFHAEALAGISGEIQREILGGGLDETLYVDEDKVKITQTTVTLPSGNRIIGRPANPRTARGFSMHVNLDEFSMHEKSDEIWAAAFPSILSNNCLRLKVSFTPKGKKGRAYKLATEQNGFSRHVVNIYDAVKAGLNINPDELRLAIGDEEIWQQECLVQFVDEATAFLSYDLIASCEHEGLAVIKRVEAQQEDTEDSLARKMSIDTLLDLSVFTGGCEIFLGVDIGRRRDLTVFWVVEKVGDVFWTRAAIEVSRMPFRHQQAFAKALMHGLQVRRACFDATGLGMQLAEDMAFAFGKHRVEEVTFNLASKAQMAEGLRPKFEDKKLRIPVDPLLREDLHNVTKLSTANGAVRYMGERSDSKGTVHPDRFWALALSMLAADGPVALPFLKHTAPSNLLHRIKRTIGRIKGAIAYEPSILIPRASYRRAA